jgi:hypothetical protein
MLLDIWVIFATGLTLLLSIGAVVVVALRARSAGKGRAELEAKCEAARVALEEGKALLEARPATHDWKQELTARLAALDAQAAATTDLSPDVAVRLVILRSELSGEPADLSSHLSKAGGAPSADSAAIETLKATNAALETELAALKAAALASAPASSAEGENAPANLARERELKSLVQQFTRDSREMLNCIQALESENRDLRASMGGATKSAA